MDKHSKAELNQQSPLHPGTSESSLVDVDSPDDMTYEGKFGEPKSNRREGTSRPYVTVDNPDDFE